MIFQGGDDMTGRGKGEDTAERGCGYLLVWQPRMHVEALKRNQSRSPESMTFVHLLFAIKVEKLESWVFGERSERWSFATPSGQVAWDRRAPRLSPKHRIDYGRLVVKRILLRRVGAHDGPVVAAHAVDGDGPP